MNGCHCVGDCAGVGVEMLIDGGTDDHHHMSSIRNHARIG